MDADRIKAKIIRELTESIKNVDMPEKFVPNPMGWDFEQDGKITGTFSWGYYGEDGLWHDMGEPQPFEITPDGFNVIVTTTTTDGKVVSTTQSMGEIVSTTTPVYVSAGDTLEFTYDIEFS